MRFCIATEFKALFCYGVNAFVFETKDLDFDSLAAPEENKFANG